MALHGAASSARYKGRLRRVVAWGMALPAALIAMAAIHPAWLALVAVYPLRILRMAWKARGAEPSANWLWASFMVLSSFPEAVGVATYWLNRSRGQRGKLIEYK